MLGIVYMILAFFVGNEIVKGLLNKSYSSRCGRENILWLHMSASFGTGVLFLTWAVYLLAWLFCCIFEIQEPLFYSNMTVCILALIMLVIIWKKRLVVRGTGLFREKLKKMIPDRKNLIRESILFPAVFFVILSMMFYVFHIRRGILYSGFTVFGDYAPHTAMMRSFSWGNNYPTQYPHFGGEDIKYHFMYQFLIGNLEYLGIRMDLAYNVVSALMLTGFLMLLYLLARRLTGGFTAGCIAVLLFFFRSGTAFFQFLWEHFRAGDLWQALSGNASFIGYTTSETWGLWNFNVYLNQRHLALGMLLGALAVWMYLDWAEAGTRHGERGWKWLGERLFTAEAWRTRDLTGAVLMGLILGFCSFWNGAAVIGTLLILCGMAVFSDGKLDYAVTAAITILFSVLQSKIFIDGEAVSPSLYIGFLAEDKSVWGILKYLVMISGFFFLGLLLLSIKMNRIQRMVLMGMLFPVIFSFTVSLTPDIAVNHKYIMISYAFLTIFWGGFLERLLHGHAGRKIAAGILILCLTATGVYDFAMILAGNGHGRKVAVDMNSELSVWLRDNLTEKDLLLSPEYSMNEVTMSGVMLYNGWPYYAWSAGYDTYHRSETAVRIYSAGDTDTLKKLVQEEGITYILYEEGMKYEEQECREDIIEETYPKVYTSWDGRIRIYETK